MFRLADSVGDNDSVKGTGVDTFDRVSTENAMSDKSINL